MNKTFIVFLGLLCCLSAFTILQKENKEGLQVIPWPFTVCGKGKWTIEKLTLAGQPKRETTDDIDVVPYLLFSWELPVMTLILPLLTST
jgi:hypothetical protein